MGWSNPLKNSLALGPLSEVAIYAPQSDWPGGRRRGKAVPKRFKLWGFPASFLINKIFQVGPKQGLFCRTNTQR